MVRPDKETSFGMNVTAHFDNRHFRRRCMRNEKSGEGGDL